MADWSTIASLATAGGTLVLGVATFSSVRSGQRTARIAERSLLAGLRPVLLPSRPGDLEQDVRFIDGETFTVAGGEAVVDVRDDNLYLALGLRNAGQGLAVLHSWHARPGQVRANVRHEPVERFRSLTRDLYVPAGDVGFWQGAIRDSADPDFEPLATAVREGETITVDILHGDHEGGQLTVTRFSLLVEADGKRSTGVTRHWLVDDEERDTGS